MRSPPPPRPMRRLQVRCLVEDWPEPRHDTRSGGLVQGGDTLRSSLDTWILYMGLERCGAEQTLAQRLQDTTPASQSPATAHMLCDLLAGSLSERLYFGSKVFKICAHSLRSMGAPTAGVRLLGSGNSSGFALWLLLMCVLRTGSSCVDPAC